MLDFVDAENIFESAAKNGNLDNMKWLKENKCSFSVALGVSLQF